MENSRYHNLNYFLRNSKTYFKFAVDENGLWVIYAAATEDDTMVAKLNPDTFSVELLINTHYPTAKAGNAFIVCGMLYFTDKIDSRVTYAFDLERESPQDASFDLRPADGILSMLSYYPNKKLLYIWDSSNMKTCKVKLKLARSPLLLKHWLHSYTVGNITGLHIGHCSVAYKCLVVQDLHLTMLG